MNVDPSTNMVVFEVSGFDEPFLVSVSTRDDQGVQRAWLSLPVEHRAAARDVTRVYSEWQPSEADESFLQATLPSAEVTYSFERPGPDGWEAAFAAARDVMAEADRPEPGELLPILWSRTSPKVEILQFLPHSDVVPGRLHLALATVATTRDGRIGMSHVTHAELAGRPFHEVFAEAAGVLAGGLRVDVHTDTDRPGKGQLLVLQRDGSFASSAVALPDFHHQMAAVAGDDRLLVGVPDPDTVLVTRMDSGWVDDLRQIVLTSPCPSSELVPTVLAFEPDGIRLVAERPPVA